MTASYSSGTSAAPLLGDTIRANFAATVARFGDREALVDKATDRRWTYAELAVEVDRAAAGLTALGVRKGDRVGIWAPNCAEWVFVQYATARIGTILVNVNPAYRVHELEYVLNQAGIHTLVSARSFKTSDYAGMIEANPDARRRLVVHGHSVIADRLGVTPEEIGGPFRCADDPWRSSRGRTR